MMRGARHEHVAGRAEESAVQKDGLGDEGALVKVAVDCSTRAAAARNREAPEVVVARSCRPARDDQGSESDQAAHDLSHAGGIDRAHQHAAGALPTWNGMRNTAAAASAATAAHGSRTVSQGRSPVSTSLEQRVSVGPDTRALAQRKTA